MWHILVDVLRDSVLISGLVVIMMMMIEAFNIESHGQFFSGLRKSRFGQVTVAALLGTIPGCLGGYATVSLYTHRMLSFGGLIAMMIASSGDEAFMMLAMIPEDALWIFLILLVVAIVAGVITDLVYKPHKLDFACHDGYEIHSEDAGPEGLGFGFEETAGEEDTDQTQTCAPRKERHLSPKRIVMFLGVALFITALIIGVLGHDHAETARQHGGVAIDLLDEQWMNALFGILSVVVLAVLVVGSDHFIEEHLWEHIVKRHLPSIFAWTLGVLLLINVFLHFVDISGWISENVILMILVAALVGIIPESGPHLIFVTLYAGGIVPLPVLLANCISQDGHASIPLLAESKRSFLYAKAINFTLAVTVGMVACLFC